MMRPITFTFDPAALSHHGRGICVYHKAYRHMLPDLPNCLLVEFSHLCETYQTRDWFTGAEIVVFVGANRFFTPSTRFHGVFEVLQYGLPGIKRYSVDVSPYVGPLWRLWAHWSFAGLPWNGYTYSYLLESHYKAWKDGVRPDNPMADEYILANSAGVVDMGYRRFFLEPEVRVIEVGPAAHAEYQRLKEELFATHHTIRPIIKGLADFAASVCPERRIQQPHTMFRLPKAGGKGSMSASDRGPVKISITRTDLKVDEYLAGRLLDKINEVNRVCEVLQ